MNTLSLIIGCMFSGKTTELLRQLTILSKFKKCLYINNSLDTRNKEGVFSTHNPLYKNKIENIDMVSYTDEEFKNNMENMKTYDVIGIDEFQFFNIDIQLIVELVDIHKKTIFITSLDGDFNRNVFGKVFELIPYCDTIIKQHSYCSNCSNNKTLHHGIFTHKKKKQDDVIDVGADESYISLCRECYVEKN